MSDPHAIVMDLAAQPAPLGEGGLDPCLLCGGDPPHGAHDNDRWITTEGHTLECPWRRAIEYADERPRNP